jgi:hypothetical protein
MGLLDANPKIGQGIRPTPSLAETTTLGACAAAPDPSPGASHLMLE